MHRLQLSPTVADISEKTRAPLPHKFSYWVYCTTEPDHGSNPSGMRFFNWDINKGILEDMGKFKQTYIICIFLPLFQSEELLAEPALNRATF